MWLFEWNFHWSVGFEKLYFSMLGARKKNQRLAIGYLRKVPMQETLHRVFTHSLYMFRRDKSNLKLLPDLVFSGECYIHLERLATKREWSWLTATHYSSEECGSDSTFSFSFTIVTWLILPVVICLSQRLSHACLSISNYTAKLRMAH